MKDKKTGFIDGPFKTMQAWPGSTNTTCRGSLIPLVGVVSGTGVDARGGKRARLGLEDAVQGVVVPLSGIVVELQHVHVRCLSVLSSS
jgi:hypothetical protein